MLASAPMLLYRQGSFADRYGEPYPKRIDVKGEECIIAHEISEFYQTLDAKLGERRIESGLADPVGPEEFLAIAHHGRFIWGQVCQLLLCTQAVDDVIPDASLPGQAGVGVPDELTVQFPRRENHRQLPDFEREARGFAAQVGPQMFSPLQHLGDIDHDGERAITGHIATLLDECIKNGLLCFRNAIARCLRYPCHGILLQVSG